MLIQHSTMTTSNTAESRRRRPQWRGDRKAILVRMPVALAHRLTREAEERQRSVSEHATDLLAAALDPDGAA
jgi:hypothetical protein